MVESLTRVGLGGCAILVAIVSALRVSQVSNALNVAGAISKGNRYSIFTAIRLRRIVRLSPLTKVQSFGSFFHQILGDLSSRTYHNSNLKQYQIWQKKKNVNLG